MKLFGRALLCGALGAVIGVSAPAQAAEYVGNFKSECQGSGGFTNCYATKNGIVKGPLATGIDGSPTVVKYSGPGGGLSDVSSNFSSVSGKEFQILFDALTHVLSFTYTPGANDPEIHWFSIKQGNETALFYDASAILAGAVDLDNYFKNGNSYSHITFYDTKAGGGTGGDGGAGGVPEPGTWALMLFGFGGIGVAVRRRRRNGNLFTQAA